MTTKEYHELEMMEELALTYNEPEKEKVEEPVKEPIKQYIYDCLWKYAFDLKDSVDSEIEKVFIEEDLESRFNVSLEEFKVQVEEAWKDYERMYDDYDKDYEYDYEYDYEEEQEEW